MALTDYKINGYEGKDVASAPDKLTGTAQQNKAVFDSLFKGVFENKYNDLVDYLSLIGAEQIVRHSDGSITHIRLNTDKVIETSTDGIVWQATGSSGHLIMDTSGNTLAQRSRLKFTNSIVRDVNGVTEVEGIKGDQGIQGIQGIQGLQGIQGERGLIGKTIVPSIDAFGVMSFSVQDTAIAPNPISIRGPQGVQGVQGQQGVAGPQGLQGVQGVAGPQGIKGNDGADGRSFVIQDVYPTLGALKTALPTGNEYAYQVSFDKNIYIWSETVADWVSLGQLQGPQGPQGPQGVTGNQGIQGIQGVSGIDGKTAFQSATEGGYSGSESAFNNSLGQVPGHIESTEIHVTANDKTNWNGKAAGNHNHDLAYAPIAHSNDSAIHVTASDKTNWNGKASASHTQAASTITAGTLGGQVLANATAQATIGTAQVRNIHAGTTDIGVGAGLATGAIYVVYEG